MFGIGIHTYFVSWLALAVFTHLCICYCCTKTSHGVRLASFRWYQSYQVMLYRERNRYGRSGLDCECVALGL